MTVGFAGLPTFACYQYDGKRYRLGAAKVLSMRDGRIAWIAGFVEPHFLLPLELPRPDR